MRDPWSELTRAQRKERWKSWRARLGTMGSLLGGAVLVGTLAAALTGLSADHRQEGSPGPLNQEVAELRLELDDARGKLALAEVKLEHQQAVAKYSAAYGVPADLAEAIYDIALAEGLHPSLAFQLVKVESRFKADARSVKDAIGYTQLRLATARGYDPNITERDLLDRDTNLRIGFRFLKDLLAQFDQDINLALLAYNRGPTRVMEMVTRGEDPSNGYAEAVLRKVKKSGS